MMRGSCQSESEDHEVRFHEGKVRVFLQISSLFLVFTLSMGFLG